jgi:hypothetical protein
MTNSANRYQLPNDFVMFGRDIHNHNAMATAGIFTKSKRILSFGCLSL